MVIENAGDGMNWIEFFTGLVAGVALGHVLMWPVIRHVNRQVAERQKEDGL